MQTTLQKQHQDQAYNNNRQFVNNERGNSRQSANKHFKSPSRTMYQQRYPVTFKMDNANNNNNNSDNNYNYNSNSNTSNNKNNNRSQIKMSISPPKYRDQQNYQNQNRVLYNDVINMNNSLSRMSQPMNNNNNNAHNYQSSSIVGYGSYADRTYTSPSKGTAGGGGFVSSPYINNMEAGSYYGVPSSGIDRYIDHRYQESYIKPKQSAIQLQKLTSQLKLSLQQSLNTQQSLQQQLNKQRARSFQLSQMKRKLQQQLGRMQFQLDRISNGDLLGQKELMIKYENEVKENERLNGEIGGVREELKKLRGEYREVVSESNKVKQENQMLRKDNVQLIRKLEEFTQHFKQMSEQEYNSNNYGSSNNNNSKAFVYNNIQSQQSMMKSSNQMNRNPLHSPSIAINTINTTRSNNQQSAIMYSRNVSTNYNNNMSNLKLNINNKTHNIKHAPQYRQLQPIDYDQQNSKLLDDYNKLMSENESMKKLYQEFYQPSKPVSPSGNIYHNYEIGEEPEEMEETRKGKFYHAKGNYDQQQEQYQYHPSSQDPQQSQRLQTFQKTQLYQQVSTLRQQIVHSLIENYYSPSVFTAKQQKANVLVIFIKTINRNLDVIEKMVINYLQARDIMKKELQTNNLQQMQQQQFQPETKLQKQAQQLWLNTKAKLKTQLKAHTLPNNNTLTAYEIITLNINAYYLALFRLLTIIHKHMTNNMIQKKSNHHNSLSKIKHSALKYIHKQSINLNIQDTRRNNQNQTKLQQVTTNKQQYEDNLLSLIMNNHSYFSYIIQF